MATSCAKVRDEARFRIDFPSATRGYIHRHKEVLDLTGGAFGFGRWARSVGAEVFDQDIQSLLALVSPQMTTVADPFDDGPRYDFVSVLCDDIEIATDTLRLLTEGAYGRLKPASFLMFIHVRSDTLRGRILSVAQNIGATEEQLKHGYIRPSSLAQRIRATWLRLGDESFCYNVALFRKPGAPAWSSRVYERDP